MIHKYKYTIKTTTHSLSCSNCGKTLEEYTESTDLLIWLLVLIFPISLPGIILYFAAFLSPQQASVGKKYVYCPQCFNIMKTGDVYAEELFGVELLNYKMSWLFTLSYVLGAAINGILIAGLFIGYSTFMIVAAIVCACVIVAIIITYRILRAKAKNETEASASALYEAEIKDEVELKLITLKANNEKEAQLRKEQKKRKLTKEEKVKLKIEKQKQKEEMKKAKEKKEEPEKKETLQEFFDRKIPLHKKWLAHEDGGELLMVEKQQILNVPLQGVQIQYSVFSYCTFNGLDLTKTSFRNSEISHSTFMNCILTDTDFIGVNLDTVHFLNCNEKDAVYEQEGNTEAYQLSASASGAEEKPEELEEKMENDSQENDYGRFMDQAIDIIIDNVMDDDIEVNEFFDARKLCKDICAFCDDHYDDSEKRVSEYFISAYYEAICLTIHHIKDEAPFDREHAFSFLASQCDIEFCDIYSDRLLGQVFRGTESDEVWEFGKPVLGEILDYWRESEDESEDFIFSGMEAMMTLGIANAYENYISSDDESEYVGKQLSLEMLVGRNYYHYTNGEPDEEQPLVLETPDIEPSDDDPIDQSNRTTRAGLSAFVAHDCWIKKISANDEESEGNRIIAIEVDDDFRIKQVTEVREEIQSYNFGLSGFTLPGLKLPLRRSYENRIDLSEESEEEMELLLKQRILPQNFSLIGKKLPEKMYEEDGDETSRTYALQSPYRRAYMVMQVSLTEDGIIEELDYSTYQSTGNGYQDMFSRPEMIDDKHEEIVDMMLYVIDKWTVGEYEAQ